jgi:tellurite resistance protein TerC
MEFLTVLFLGQPLWMWLAFLGVVGLLLAFDLGILHRDNHEIGIRESLLLSGLYIALGLVFGAFVWVRLGHDDAVAYVTGFVVEKSLAMDNVFVIAMIFAYLAIPREYQHRVLFWGVVGVILLRAVMIAVGTTLVSEFAWVLYLFAAFLIATGIKMLWWEGKESDLGRSPVLKLLRRCFRVTDRLHGERFFVRLADARTGRLATYMTPMFLALVMIEVADLIFAVDSVPAIFAITTDPYIVYTSNIFAILGLRALYFALAAVLNRFAYLKQALGVLLIFIGSKIFVADLFGWAKFPAEWSLGITFAILAAGVLYSLGRTRAPGQSPAIEGDR